MVISQAEYLMLKDSEDKLSKIQGVLNNTTLSERECTDKIAAIVNGTNIEVGDVCTYKGYTDVFVVTHIDEGLFFDGIYASGQTINDGKLESIEKVNTNGESKIELNHLMQVLNEIHDAVASIGYNPHEGEDKGEE